jgi:hypothetical protein
MIAAADWSAGLGIYNILNRRASTPEFGYIDRLQDEPLQGVPDVHQHPLEPLAVRQTVSKTF